MKFDPGLWGGLRLGVSALLFLAGLLAVIKPPSYSFWKLSIVVMEGGHFLVLPCLLLGFWSLRGDGSGKLAGILFLAAAGLYAATALRAQRVSRQLEKKFAAEWPAPEIPPAWFLRSRVLSFTDLFTGVPLGDTAFKTLVYKEAKAGREAGDPGLRMDFYAARKRDPSKPASLDSGRDAGPHLRHDARPAACVVVVHGGGWDGGARSQLAPLNGFLAAQGYAVAALQYRLAPRHRYPAPMEDVADALAYLRAHATELGIDTARFVLLGRSAGGQIALNAAYTFRDPSIKGVIGFYSPADMVFGYSLPTNPLIMDSRLLMEQYLGGSYPENPEAYVASSPVEHLASDSPPTLLLAGRPDVLVSYQHTVHMRHRMQKLGIRHFIVDLPWAAHGFDFVFRGPGSQISLYFIERFLAEVTL